MAQSGRANPSSCAAVSSKCVAVLMGRRIRAPFGDWYSARGLRREYTAVVQSECVMKALSENPGRGGIVKHVIVAAGGMILSYFVLEHMENLHSR